MTDTTRLSTAGLEVMFWAIADDDGLPAGATGTIAADTYEEMSEVPGVESFDPQVAEPARVSIPGNDGVLFTYQFKPSENPVGTLQMGILDLNLAANPTGNAVQDDTTHKGVLLQPDSFDNKNVWLVANSQAYNADSAAYGNVGYGIDVYRANLYYLGRAGRSSQAAGAYRFAVTLNPFSRYIDGSLLSLANNSATRAVGKEGMFDPGKRIYGTYVGDTDTQTSFTLGHTPLNGAASIKAWTINKSTLAQTELTIVTTTPSVGELEYDATDDSLTGEATDYIGAGNYIIVEYHY